MIFQITSDPLSKKNNNGCSKFEIEPQKPQKFGAKQTTGKKRNRMDKDRKFTSWTPRIDVEKRKGLDFSKRLERIRVKKGNCFYFFI